ncbi:MAG: alkaline phosphatase family protein [Myxococcales bacterium]|nr:alkaline phosphatase family protein [Myxococcales bacterium]
MERGNVLFVTADQWRAECLSGWGHPIVRTPNLDALAAEGVHFTRHYAQAAPCGPSRASIHTGQYLMNHRSGTNGTPLDARHTNWAFEARRHGYAPVLFGYTDTSQDPRAFASDDPLLRTYEGPLPGLTSEVLMAGDGAAWARWLADKGYEIPEPTFGLYKKRKDGVEWEDGGPAPLPLAIPAEHHDTAFMVGEVIDYVRERAASPWFVHLSLLRPHPPWHAPEPYNALYPPDELPAPTRAPTFDEEVAEHPWLAYHLSRRYYRAPDDDRKLRRLAASYYGLMTEVDDQLGRLFAFLQETGEWDRTLVVFGTDHGEQLGDHWMLDKGGYFEQSYHIPLIIRDPRPEATATRGSRVEAFTENVDLMPTMLDWIGAETPVQCDGSSLLPFVEGGEAPSRWRSEAHFEFDFREPQTGGPERALDLTLHQCSLNVLRGERYKYVHFTALPPLFFDLQEDPEERVNRALDPACRDLVLEHAQRLLSWRMNHDEQTLTHMALTPDGVFERRAPRF